jgi:hypothetical protein
MTTHLLNLSRPPRMRLLVPRLALLALLLILVCAPVTRAVGPTYALSTGRPSPDRKAASRSTGV